MRLRKPIKLKLLFKSGREVCVECDQYEFNYDSVTLEFTGYTIRGGKPLISFNPRELEGYIAE